MVGEKMVHLDVDPFDELNQKIVQWGHDRQIIENSTPQAQFLKCVSEVGELGDALAKGQHSEMIDAIGDVYVTLCMVAECAGVDVPFCVQQSWEVIKDRKGHLTPEGVFVKEE